MEKKVTPRARALRRTYQPDDIIELFTLSLESASSSWGRHLPPHNPTMCEGEERGVRRETLTSCENVVSTFSDSKNVYTSFLAMVWVPSVISIPRHHHLKRTRW